MGTAPCSNTGHVESRPESPSNQGQLDDRDDAEGRKLQAAADKLQDTEDKDAVNAQNALDVEAERKTKEDEDAAAMKEEQDRLDEKKRRLEELESLLADTRAKMKQDPTPPADGKKKRNRYGDDARLPEFTKGVHVPTVALINPAAGAHAGSDIMEAARHSPYYQDRFFNIIHVVKGQKRGELLDVFRFELLAAKEEAKAMGVRARIISGGGDGTASFALFILFKALKAQPDREDEGLQDTGNGFIWTEEEFSECFPALAQLPLGSANDFGNILGWGQKYPGDFKVGGQSSRMAALEKWINAVINKDTPIANFDVFGIMPPKGQDTCDFKICELTGKKGRKPHIKVDGKNQLVMKEAGPPTPFYSLLYFSTGFGAYMIARFQINRRNTPIQNRLEYVRQGVGIVFESTPPQLMICADGVTVDCEEQPYFPPRREKGNKGRKYREVGMLNVNWQAHLVHGKDRANCCMRLPCGCGSSRAPVSFNDGQLDMYRMRLMTPTKDMGLTKQVDKKKDFLLNFEGGKGKGIFFQYDGEGRFAFSPDGNPFSIFMRKVLNLPVVVGPFTSKGYRGNIDNGKAVKFEFHGETAEELEATKRRVVLHIDGGIDKELNGTKEEIARAAFPCDGVNGISLA